MSRWVLDASAVLALLQAEPGAETVSAVIEAGVISAVNWTEVVGKLAIGGMPHAQAVSTINALPAAVYPFTREHAALAAELVPVARPLGLSLADRACLALGRFTGWPVLTADRKWEGVAAGVTVQVIR